MNLILSFLIIGLVSISVFTGASYSLRLGSGQESNISKISYFYQRSLKPNIFPKNTVSNPQIAGATSETACVAIVGADKSNIVDYLYSRGENYSFNYRKTLASDLGIINYLGTKEQNILLLKKLKERHGDCNYNENKN